MNRLEEVLYFKKVKSNVWLISLVLVFLVESRVHGGDGILELGLELGPLELHGRGEEAGLDGEGLRRQVDGLDLLEPVQLGAPPLLLDAPEHGHHDPPVLAERVHVLRQAPLLGPNQHVVWIRRDDGDEVAPERVSVHEDLEHEGAPLANLLDLLRGHVLSLRQLEEVLLPVNDLQLPTGNPAAHIPSVEPAVLIQNLLRLRLVVVVPADTERKREFDFQSGDLISSQCGSQATCHH
mmetsp:Transcript_4106/g.10480  ORF Transcript_4106/g.10480 Transcript_4106/m.10480 type:complete len:237 (+) Transcript_4106:107-817(+)